MDKSIRVSPNGSYRYIGQTVGGATDTDETKAQGGATMKSISRHVLQHAHQLATAVKARAVVVYADAIEGNEELRQALGTVNLPTILITRKKPSKPPDKRCAAYTWVAVPDVHMTRSGQVKIALLVCLAQGVLVRADRVVCLTGVDGTNIIDTLMVLDLGTEPELFSTLNAVAQGSDVRPEVFERTLALATQLAVEGREGRPVGAIFVLGESEAVLAQSRNLVLNPFRGYPEAERSILDPALEETIKEFSAIDGAFVIRGDGVVLSAGAQLLPTVAASALPRGLGTRHAAAAAITASTGAVAIAVSQSTGTVSVFKSGLMITDIHKPAYGNRLAV
jgi:DNA integrity scanning protein DisA with diadenylate cyclase activity